jgi:hypothetical protein
MLSSDWPWESPRLVQAPSGTFFSQDPVADPDSGVWINGGSYRWRNGTWDSSGASYVRIWRDVSYNLYAQESASILKLHGDKWRPLAPLPTLQSFEHFRLFFNAPDGSPWAVKTSTIVQGGGFCPNVSISWVTYPLAGSRLLESVPSSHGVTHIGFDAGGTLWLSNNAGLIWGKPATTALRPIPKARRIPQRPAFPTQVDVLGRNGKGWMSSLRRWLNR